MALKKIEKSVCVCVWESGGREGGGADALKLSIVMHFLCGRSRTRLKNSSEISNLDIGVNLDLDLAEIWIQI